MIDSTLKQLEKSQLHATKSQNQTGRERYLSPLESCIIMDCSSQGQKSITRNMELDLEDARLSEQPIRTNDLADLDK